MSYPPVTLPLPQAIEMVHRRLGIPVLEMARQVGCSKTQMNDWRNGRARPTVRFAPKLIALASRANVTIEPDSLVIQRPDRKDKREDSLEGQRRRRREGR